MEEEETTGDRNKGREKQMCKKKNRRERKTRE